MQFIQPPILHNEQGNIRTVGFELEYSNLGIRESVQIIQDLYGGEVEPISRYKHRVLGTSLGDFTVEFDLTLLTEKGYRKFFDTFNIHPEEVKLGAGTLEEGLEEALESIVGKVFPYEIACPPVPCTELHELEKLRNMLYLNKAEGTKSFLTNAFGTHINVETPSLATDTVLSYLRAFLLLYPWLVEYGQTDLARRLSPFIDPYPEAYTILLLAQNYNPDQEQLIQDYHTYSPDRNRPLDMYPLFAKLNNELISQYKGLGKVKPRSTFHYRLPNSSVSQPDWTLAQEWNNWVKIEEVASDKQKLAEMCNEYLALKQDTLIGFDNKWIKRTEQWLT